jgi:death-on-curing protein
VGISGFDPGNPRQTDRRFRRPFRRKKLGSIEFALAAPRWIDNFADPEDLPDVAVLAASYVVSLARAHGFHDGNKRIAWAAAAVFVDVNGFDVSVSQADIIETVQNIADATHPMGEEALVSWFRERIIGVK